MQNKISEKGYIIQNAKSNNNISDVGAGLGAGILAASFGAPVILTVCAAAAGFALAHWFVKTDKNDQAISDDRHSS